MCPPNSVPINLSSVRSSMPESVELTGASSPLSDGLDRSLEYRPGKMAHGEIYECSEFGGGGSVT